METGDLKAESGMRKDCSVLPRGGESGACREVESMADRAGRGLVGGDCLSG